MNPERSVSWSEPSAPVPERGPWHQGHLLQACGQGPSRPLPAGRVVGCAHTPTVASASIPSATAPWPGSMARTKPKIDAEIKDRQEPRPIKALCPGAKPRAEGPWREHCALVACPDSPDLALPCVAARRLLGRSIHGGRSRTGASLQWRWGLGRTKSTRTGFSQGSGRKFAVWEWARNI